MPVEIEKLLTAKYRGKPQLTSPPTVAGTQQNSLAIFS
jgi:hypothetical protein